MDMLKALNDAMRYLETELTGSPDIGQASRIAGLSKDSFRRFFSYMSGMTLNEYIRRRRLTLAALDLRDGRMKVIDAAMKYGFESADTFSRAFARQHGFPPTRAKAPDAAFRVCPPISFHIAIKGAKEMKFQLVEFAGLTLRGICEECTGTAAERFRQEHIMWRKDQDDFMTRVCPVIPGVWYGLWEPDRYWIAKPAQEAIQYGTEAVSLPAGTYAVFTTERGGLAVDELRGLREEIFDSWLPSSGYRQACELEVEVYHLYPLQPVEERRRRYYELWVPVVRANEFLI